MKILLDHCVDRRFKRLLIGHAATHTSEMGWETLVNGRLLVAAAAQGFEVLLTVDKHMREQQNLPRLPIPILQLDSLFVKMKDLMLFVPHLNAALSETRGHNFVVVDAEGRMERLAPREVQ